MDIDDAVDWQMIARKWEAHANGLAKALEAIDKIGNGTTDHGLTAYASLMRCGQIARTALTDHT